MSPAVPNDDSGACTTSQIGKGKARAKSPQPTERTPLLSSGSSPTASGIDENGLQLAALPIPPHQRLFRRLLIVFAITLCTCIVVFILILIVAYSYSSRVSNISTKDILERGLVVKGPDRVDVLNITESGEIWVRVEGRVGVDVGELLGINSAEDDLVWMALWKGLGRWGVGQLGNASISMSAIEVVPRNRSTVLAALQSLPMQLELTTDPPLDDDSWLTRVSLPVLIRPSNRTSSLVRFARDCWSTGTVDVAANVASVIVKGGGLSDHSWRTKFHMEQKDVQAGVRLKIPPLPGLPNPGRDTPLPSFSELITLKSFSLFSDLDEVLINASGTFIDPAPASLTFTAPSLSFLVSIPSTDDPLNRELIPIAAVNTSAFTLTHPNVTLDITGHVVPLASNSSPALSFFITSYLSMHSPEISISSPSFPNLTFDTVFPAPDPKPEILRNVTIKDMKIKPSSGGTMLASGVVFATAVLPKGMNVVIDIDRVFPELLVFDGPVPESTAVLGENEPEDDEVEVPDPMPLPDPLPERAFAHIRPSEWLDALSVPIDAPEGEGSTVAVSAKLVDVPLEVLPGRQSEFSKFIGKVIFGREGAVAGVSGLAAVGIHVQGLPVGDGEDKWGGMELRGLPFQGNVRIGKKDVFGIHPTPTD